MKQFKYADILAAMAERAKVSDTPWDVVQISDRGSNKWVDLTTIPRLNSSTCEYRIKPRTININGHEVPEPVSSPLQQIDGYFVPSTRSKDMFSTSYWIGDGQDLRNLERGLIHLTEEAAIAHAKALLSFTEK